MLKFILCLFITTTAFAQNYDYAGKFGLGAGLGYNWPIFGNKFQDNFDGDLNFDLHGRYYFTSALGLELAYNRHEFQETNQALRVFDIVGLYRFTPVDQFSWVAGAGLGMAELTRGVDDGYNPALKLRLGFDYSFTQSLVATLAVDYQYVNKTINEDNLYNANMHLFAPRFQLTWYFGKCEKTSGLTDAAIYRKEHPATDIAADDDKDGVINKNDKCPSTPAGVKVNAYGCGTKEKGIVQININFASGKSIVEKRYSNELKKLADFMKENPKTNVEIQGHTDSSGSKELNKKISQARASSVRTYLIENFKIEPSRLSSKGYGDEKPVESNNTAQGRALNRRVIAVISE